jgi:chemotaxis protein CheC
MNHLTELQTEAMVELFNIAYGMATSLISDSIGMHSTMYVPEMEIVSIDEFTNVAYNAIDKGKGYFIVSQVFLNYLEGETVMLMSTRSAKALTECYSKMDDSLNPEEADDVKSCTLEITNIVSSALLGRIADLTNTEIYFQPPEIRVFDHTKFTEMNKNREFTQVIVIKIIIDVDTTEVKGNMYILLKEDSFDKFRQALDYFIESYSG